MLSSPEILIVGASVVDTSGGRVDTPQWPGVFGPAGVQEHGAGTRGLLGNLRAPSVSTDISGSGTGIPTPRPTTPRRVAGSEQDARVVSPSEGNEVAPRNPGKEEEAHALKPFAGTLRVRIPSGRAWTSGRKRVLRGGG
jgi:hypothetical protein